MGAGAAARRLYTDANPLGLMSFEAKVALLAVNLTIVWYLARHLRARQAAR